MEIMQCQWLLLAVVCLTAGLQGFAWPIDTSVRDLSCKWKEYPVDQNITSWEFQMRADDMNPRGRHVWEAIVEGAFSDLEAEFPEFKLYRSTRRSMILRETENEISTRDGSPLDPAVAEAGVTYPWQQMGVLRLRQCLATEQPDREGSAVDPLPGTNGPGNMQTTLDHILDKGESELTLKLKGIDPGTFPRFQESFPPEIFDAKLGVKEECDVHCQYSRVSYSASFLRVKGVSTANLTTIRGTQNYFPSLPQILHLDPDYPLPLHFDHHMSKTYWDVGFGSVAGTVQLYINYTDERTALKGLDGLVWELSLRVRRDAGPWETRDPRQGVLGGVQSALQLMAGICGKGACVPSFGKGMLGGKAHVVHSSSSTASEHLVRRGSGATWGTVLLNHPVVGISLG